MKQMSRRRRVLAAINREPVDRVPYAVWRHFPSVDHSPAGLAQATLRFHERYGSDFIKITPRGGYAVEASGGVGGDEPPPPRAPAPPPPPPRPPPDPPSNPSPPQPTHPRARAARHPPPSPP